MLYNLVKRLVVQIRRGIDIWVTVTLLWCQLGWNTDRRLVIYILSYYRNAARLQNYPHFIVDFHMVC